MRLSITIFQYGSLTRSITSPFRRKVAGRHWLNGGRVPQMLSNEVPFSVNSSTSFQVSMQCGFTAGNTCGLQNTQNSLVVPLDVRVTMPAFTRPNGQGINKLLLTTQRETFVPSRTFVIDSLSKIHFSVGQQGVKTMTEWPAQPRRERSVSFSILSWNNGPVFLSRTRLSSFVYLSQMLNF